MRYVIYGVMAFLLIGCPEDEHREDWDDDDYDTEDEDEDAGTEEDFGYCDELLDDTLQIIDSVCEVYPDCFFCDYDGSDMEDMTEESCEDALDNFDPMELYEIYSLGCEQLSD